MQGPCSRPPTHPPVTCRQLLNLVCTTLATTARTAAAAMQILARPTRTQPATRAGPNAYRAEPQQLRTQDSTVSIGTDGANPAALQMEPMLSAIAQHGSLPPSRIGSPGPAVASTQHQFPSALYPAAASAGPTSFTCMTGVIRVGGCSLGGSPGLL
jgi:hypothetical protein